MGLNKKKIEKAVDKRLKNIKHLSRSHSKASKKNIFQLANDLCMKFEEDENVLNDVMKSLGIKESDFIEK